MVVKTLKEASTVAVGNAILGGRLQNYHLNEKISHIIYSQITSKFHRPSVELYQRFLANSRIEQISLNPKDLRDLIINELSFDELKFLELTRVTQTNMEEITKTIMEKNDFYYTNFDILTIMKLLMDAPYKLQHLKLHRCDLISTRKSMIKLMCETYHNVTTLDLTKTKLTPTNFRVFCRNYPNLTQLNISQTETQDLRGMMHLQSLQVLIMIGACVTDIHSMCPIFQCRNLTVVNMSGYGQRHCPNIKTYLACKTFLPKLRLLDISFNDIREKELQTLIANHPDLELICLIGTQLQSREQIYKNEKPLLITCHGLEDSLDALKHYKAHTELPKKVIVLKAIEHNLRNWPGGMNRELLHTTLQALLPTAETIQAWKHVQFETVRCLYELRTHDFEQLDFSDIQHLIDTLLNVCDHIWEEESPEDKVYVMQGQVWGLLQVPNILHNTPHNIDHICRKAAVIIKQTRNPYEDEETTPLFGCLRVLSLILREKEYGAVKNLCKDTVLIDHIIRLMEHFDFKKRTNCRWLPHFLSSTHNLISYSGDQRKNPERTANAISVWIRKLEEFEYSHEVQSRILKKIMLVIERCPFRHSILFEKRHLAILTKLLSRHGSSQQEEVVRLFNMLKAQDEFDKNPEFPRRWKNWMTQEDKIVTDLKKWTGRGKNYLEMYHFLVGNDTISAETSGWVWYVLSSAEQEQQRLGAEKRPIVVD